MFNIDLVYPSSTWCPPAVVGLSAPISHPHHIPLDRNDGNCSPKHLEGTRLQEAGLVYEMVSLGFRCYLIHREKLANKNIFFSFLFMHIIACIFFIKKMKTCSPWVVRCWLLQLLPLISERRERRSWHEWLHWAEGRTRSYWFDWPTRPKRRTRREGISRNSGGRWKTCMYATWDDFFHADQFLFKNEPMSPF